MRSMTANKVLAVCFGGPWVAVSPTSLRMREVVA